MLIAELRHESEPTASNHLFLKRATFRQTLRGFGELSIALTRA